MPGLHHVGLTVSDLDRAVKFYRDHVGCPVVDRFTGEGEAFETAVSVPGATASFAHLEAGEGLIEVVEYEPAIEGTPVAGLNRPGTCHVGLAVDDVRAVERGLPDHVKRLSEPKTTGSGTTLVFCRDPDGNLVELIER